MANYYQSGYMPPAGIRNASDVKRKQKELGVKVDGIWGPETQAAYIRQAASAGIPGSKGTGSYSAPKGVDSVGQIKQIQKQLGVKIDGIWGKNTQAAWEAAYPTVSNQTSNYVVKGYTTPVGVNSAAAVRNIQKDLGVAQDGIWGAKTQAAWNAKQEAPSDYVLNGYSTPKYVNSSEEVKRIQRSLNVEADGIWGPKTQAAWNAKQKNQADYVLKGYLVPDNIHSAEQVKKIQRALKIEDDGIWGPKTQAAWEAMRSGGKMPESQYTMKGYSTPPGVDSDTDVRRIQKVLGVKQDGIWGPDTQAAWDKMNQENQELDKYRAATKDKSLLDVYNEKATGALKESLDLEITGSELKKTDKKRALSFVEELNDEQRSSVLQMIDEYGAKSVLSGDNMFHTAQDVVLRKDVTEAKVISADAGSAYETSLLRPTRIGGADQSGVSFSEYYYSNGEYCFDIYYNDEWFSQISVGRDFPEEVQLSINTMNDIDMVGRQIKLLGSIYGQGLPEILLGLETGLGDQEITSLLGLPLISDVLDKYNEAFEVPYYEKGDIQIVIKKHMPSGNTVSGWSQETIYIPA